MSRHREYIEWDSAKQVESKVANKDELNSPFDDPVIRERMIEIIIRAATCAQNLPPARK
jgi:hypothetical protein